MKLNIFCYMKRYINGILNRQAVPKLFCLLVYDFLSMRYQILGTQSVIDDEFKLNYAMMLIHVYTTLMFIYHIRVYSNTYLYFGAALLFSLLCHYNSRCVLGPAMRYTCLNREFIVQSIAFECEFFELFSS